MNSNDFSKLKDTWTQHEQPLERSNTLSQTLDLSYNTVSAEYELKLLFIDQFDTSGLCTPRIKPARRFLSSSQSNPTRVGSSHQSPAKC